MAVEVTCPHCNHVVVFRYLKLTDEGACPLCGKPIPMDEAEPTDEEPTPRQPRQNTGDTEATHAKPLLSNISSPAGVGVLLLGCWATMLLGPATLLIIPALVVGSVLAVRKKSWIELVLILILNPLAFFFAGGIVDYFGGAPELRFMGLPRIESFNLDRSSRCFQSGGGCMISGNEWVANLPHNGALRLMSLFLGPPSKSYDGPYPTKEKALALTAGVSPSPVSDLLQGNVDADGETIALQPDLVSTLVEGLGFSATPQQAQDKSDTQVRAALYQDRCLVLRLSRGRASGENGVIRWEMLVLFDRSTKRPFAYFNIGVIRWVRYPPVTYLPEQGR